MLVQVQARMQTLKEKLFAHVNEVLDGVEEPVLPAVRSGPWKSVWEKATRFLRRSGNEAHSDQELKHKLQELHQDIKGQISNEVLCTRPAAFYCSIQLSTVFDRQATDRRTDRLYGASVGKIPLSSS